MPKYQVNGPDGRKFQVDVPQGVTEEQVKQYVIDSHYKTGASEVKPASASPLPDYGQLNTTPSPELPQFGRYSELYGPRIPRETAKAALPYIGSTIGAMAGGAGVALPALYSALGASIGKGLEGAVEGKPDLYDITKEGIQTGIGTLVGGMAFKGLGALANKVYQYKPIPLMVERAAKFAAKNKLPFSLASAAPENLGGQISIPLQQTTLPIRILNQYQAKKAAQFINKSLLDDVPDVAKNAKPIQQVVDRGIQFFKNIADPISAEGEQGFKAFTNAVGKDTPIPTNGLFKQIDYALESLRRVGRVKVTPKGALKSSDKLGKYLIDLKASGPGPRTLEEYEQIRQLITSLSADSKHKIIGDALKKSIINDYDQVGSQAGVSAGQLAEQAIQKFAKFAKFKEQYPDIIKLTKMSDPKGWLNALFKEQNARALATLRKSAPKMYYELSDTWLASQIQNYTRAETGVFGRVLDGKNFRTWFVNSKPLLRKVLGGEKTQVLDNFSRYAQYMDNFVKLGEKSAVSGVEGMLRGGTEAAGFVTNPVIMVVGEPSAFFLAKGLTNPNSVIFKLFAKGLGPQVKKGIKTGAMMGGKTTIDLFSNTQSGQSIEDYINKKLSNGQESR